MDKHCAEVTVLKQVSAHHADRHTWPTHSTEARVRRSEPDLAALSGVEKSRGFRTAGSLPIGTVPKPNGGHYRGPRLSVMKWEVALQTGPVKTGGESRSP